jgi:hypothetical protein
VPGHLEKLHANEAFVVAVSAIFIAAVVESILDEIVKVLLDGGTYDRGVGHKLVNCNERSKSRKGLRCCWVRVFGAKGCSITTPPLTGLLLLLPLLTELLLVILRDPNVRLNFVDLDAKEEGGLNA